MIRFVGFLVVSVFAALPLRAEVDIQEITTPGGIGAWLVEEHSIPFVALELRFRGGASLDLPEKRGASYLMSGLLEEGAGDYDARSFAAATESLAASFSYDVRDDTLSVSAKFLTENQDQAIALLKESLINPRFDPDAVERVRAQVISGIQSDLRDPRSIASTEMGRRVYGVHPYAFNYQGSVESVSTLTREDIIASHQATMVRSRVFASAVGDITARELEGILDFLLQDLPETGPDLPSDAKLSFDGQTHIVDFETPQSVVVFGQPGLGLEDPDFFAAYILNVILGGGGFESRLMHEVREKRGLTYGVYTYLADKDQAQVWMGSVSSANDRVAEAVAVIRDEWKRLRDHGVTQQELDDAKTYLTGAYPLRFDGNGPIARIMVGMQMDNLGTDYIATRNDQVNAVTLDDINRVARDYLSPDELTFVVVGRPEGLSN